MRIEMLEYLTDYIKENYPMYYKESEQVLFMSFVNKIASDFSFKERIGNRPIKSVLESGELNNIIDDLVEKYAKVLYGDHSEKFGTFCNYIRAVIYKKSDNPKLVNDKLVDNISEDIALYIIRSNDLGYDYYMSGFYDDILYSHYLARFENINVDGYNHIKNVIDSSPVKVNIDKETYDNILNGIFKELVTKYQLDNIISGELDDEIVKKFKVSIKHLRLAVKNYIRSFVEGIIPLGGIPVDVVVCDMTDLVMKKGSLSATELLSGGLDNDIEEYANKKRIENDPTKARLHVRKRISHMKSCGMTESELDEKAEEMLGILHKNHNCLYIDIENGKHDDLIDKIAIFEAIKYSSVKNEKSPNNVKHDTKKRKLSKTRLVIIILAIVAMIGTGSLVYKAGSVIGDRISGWYYDVKNADAVKAVDDLDDFNYTYIHTRFTDVYEPTAKNVLNFYTKLIDAGYDEKGYDYLGFYRAYMHISDNRLEIMDHMLDFVQSEASKNSDKYGEFYNEIQYNTCYLSFACDRLYDMGYTEIREDKYKNAVLAYENAMWAYPGEEPIKKLSDKDREVVEEIMQKYREYSKKYEAQLGNMLLDGDILAHGNGGRI